MRISNVKVYGIDESIIASGYPMSVETYDYEELTENGVWIDKKDNKRAKYLGNAIPGSGHDCFLKGIIVQADIKAPEYFWRQMDRYHFRDYVSSQSKMHRILKMDLGDMTNKYVDERVLNILEEKILEYEKIETWIKEEKETSNNKEELTQLEKERKTKFQEIISNVPAGLELTARITTNYLQLKSMHSQRKNHKLEEWRKEVCPWILNLPRFKELTGAE